VCLRRNAVESYLFKRARVVIALEDEFLIGVKFTQQGSNARSDLDDIRVFEADRYCRTLRGAQMRAARETAPDRRKFAPISAPARHGRDKRPLNGDD